ncbi:hypothetical protein ACTPEF_25940, partial [Clostridioides difficile]
KYLLYLEFLDNIFLTSFISTSGGNCPLFFNKYLIKINKNTLNGPDISELDEIKYGYLKMIQKARKYIYIQSPYLILDSTFIDTL